MTIQICIGSACHLKGSYAIIEKLQELIEKDGLKERITIKAAFCLGNCTNAVSVKVDDGDVTSVDVEGIEPFYIAVKAALEV